MENPKPADQKWNDKYQEWINNKGKFNQNK